MQAATSQPERLAQYDIVATLAQGHSGWVFYKGFDPILRRNATVRAIPKRLLENYGAAMAARLQNEVAGAARLHHPGIVGVYEYGEDSDWAFIATEFVEGSCLKEHSRVSVADAVSLIVQVLSALDFAHSQRIIHSDIKPSNLLVTQQGNIRIANFGFAELNPGTPAYLSPEQLAGGAADPRSDLFSAGVVFYELLTGTNPFAGPPENLVQRVRTEKERLPSDVNPELPRTFDAVCAKALAKSVQERYQTARSFSDAVRDAFESTFSSSPSRAVSNETFMTATFPRPAVEPDFGAAPRNKDGGKVPTPAANSKWDEATLHSVEKHLAVFMGPLARIIVKDAAAKTTDLEELYKLASESLKLEEERRTFLAHRNSPLPAGGPSEPSKVAPPDSKPRPPASDTPHRAMAPVIPSKNAVVRPVTPPKPAAAPSVLPPPRPAPAARVEPGSEVRAQAKSPVVSLPKPEPKAVPKPEAASVQKPPVPPAPPEARAIAKPDVSEAVARIEALVGKQPETLAGYLHDDPAQLEQVIHGFVASVQALIAMHATGNKKEALIPQSICFDRLGKATIQALQPTATRGTSSGAGNPRYAAPEIFSEKSSGSDAAMAGAHVYALGVMFYEILLGRRLFGKTFADQRTDLDWLRWHADLESRAPQVKSLLPDYPVALSDLIESMMEKHAEKRTTDLNSILSRTRDIAQRANKTIVLGKAGLKQLTAKPAKQPASATKKKGKLGWVAFFLLILIVAGAGAFLWQNPDYYRTVIAPLLHLPIN
jgi:eukaryotic-like serine/threonine-protein kinase